ncbi:MAG: MBL fold metallo-hydrolase [Pseudohongiellaceae bacterium]|nr:MBL fold metallo-hydrolase [Pseudohongiellaceae bacterium]
MDTHTASKTINPKVVPFFDEDSNTFSYVVRDPSSNACAIVDSVLELDYASGTTSYKGADEIIEYVTQQGLTVEWIIETHAHADHLSAGLYIRSKVGGKLAIGEHISDVQHVFADVFNLDEDFAKDGSQFDYLFSDGETYTIGKLVAKAIHTPGHTPACMSHLIGDALFVGDTLFMPDAGTARADFPGGDAVTLYRSIQKLLQLDGDTRVFMCHDYGVGDRELEYETTIAEERKNNIHVNPSISEAEFVEMRVARDKTLGMPHLILPSLQVNIRAGGFPEPEDNGTTYLKLPLNMFS